jgi:hypothetical protein
MNSSTLLELNRELISLDTQHEADTKEFNERNEAYSSKRMGVLDKINLVKHSIDTVMFERGRSFLRLEFPCSINYKTDKRTYSMIYQSLIDDAKKDLSTGAKKLKTSYFGQKRYEGYDQRCDCGYGTGPRHGSIYQSIGLEKRNAELSDYDIECCLYVLENLDVIIENLNNNQQRGGRA